MKDSVGNRSSRVPAGLRILDGGLATELERRGADLHDSLWSAKLLVDEPERIEEVHYDYFRAGADVATTASYQATVPGLTARGLTEAQALAAIARSVELAREARRRFWDEPAHRRGRVPPLVVGSVGPYGAYLHDGSEYRGGYGLTIDALKAFHRPRIQALLEAGVDLLALETIPSRQEARALLELLGEWPDARAWMSFSCQNGWAISEGDPFADSAREAAAHPAVVAVGINCTAPQYIGPLLESAGAPAKPWVVYPNSGERFEASTGRWSIGTNGTEEPSLARLAPDWYRQGARWIGGCCRTTPDTIRAIRAALAFALSEDG